MRCQNLKLQKRRCKILILTRRIGETIVISNDITVTVLGIQGMQAKLGIQAPISVSVHREEIYRKIVEDREEAYKQNENDIR